ncbi:MAG: hypothetical protein JNL82_18810 [Myxococcales bacterium]|nr:hypothetical protein [Myxococcales bacterium]
MSAVEPGPPPRRDDALTVLAMIAALAIPLFITLNTVQSPGVLVMTSDNPTPYGYTWSLALWVVPLTLLVGWLQRSPGFHMPRLAFWRTVGVLAMLGVALDVALGDAFFEFPNHNATLGLNIYGLEVATMSMVPNVPVEELAFYFFGVAFTLVLYLWCDLHWFGLYARSLRTRLPARDSRVRFDWRAVLLGLTLIGAAFAYKRLCSPVPDGFPGYFGFLVLVAFVPACMVFRAVRHRVNWRAFSFTALVMFTVSTWWEATVAFPYQWWTYRDEMMIGVFIRAWNGLPIEEPILWLLVSFTTVLVFEANLLHLLARRSQDEVRFVQRDAA